MIHNIFIRSVFNSHTTESRPNQIAKPITGRNLRFSKLSDLLVQLIQRTYLSSHFRPIYRHICELYDLACKELQKKQERGDIKENLHPLEEQYWFIQYFRDHQNRLSPEDVFFLIYQLDNREKYVHYFEDASLIEKFEVIFPIYFVPSLSPCMLKAIFLSIFKLAQPERDACLKKLLNVLHFKQGRELIAELMSDLRISINEKEIYVSSLLDHMRNAQIEWAEPVIPDYLKKKALKKLYPYEVVDFLERETSSVKRRSLVKEVLKECPDWWKTFSSCDVSCAINAVKKID